MLVKSTVAHSCAVPLINTNAQNMCYAYRGDHGTINCLSYLLCYLCRGCQCDSLLESKTLRVNCLNVHGDLKDTVRYKEDQYGCSAILRPSKRLHAEAGPNRPAACGRSRTVSSGLTVELGRPQAGAPTERPLNRGKLISSRVNARSTLHHCAPKTAPSNNN